MISSIFPGSFDPVTLGHVNIIKRASKITDKLYVAPLLNNNKTNIFSIEERICHLKKVTSNLKNVEIVTFSGLLLDFVLKNNITYIIKGLRTNSDFEKEFLMASTISSINKDVETIFIPTSLKYLPLSSSIVRDAAMLHADLKNLVPPEIIDDIKEKYKY